MTLFIFLKRHSRRFIALFLTAICLCSSLAATAKDAKPAATSKTSGPIPLEAFYRDRILSDIEISPDGSKLMALKNIQGKTYVLIYDMKTGATNYPTMSDNTEFKFNWIRWANNERILMSLRFSSRLNSTQRYDETRLLSMSSSGGKMISLMKPNPDAPYDHVPQFQDNIISMLPEDPKHILISVDRDLPLHQTVYKVDVYTGKLSRVLKYKTSVRSWLADRQGNVRAGVSFDDDERKSTIKILDPNTNKWVEAWSYTIFDEPEINALGFGENPNDFYLFADHEGYQALYKADLSKPGYPKELIYAVDGSDISGRLIYSRALKKVVGLYTSERAIFFDNDFKAFQAGLDRALPDSDNYIASISDNGRQYVVTSYSPTNPGTMYVGDRDQKTLSPIAVMLPELTEDVLVAKELRHFKARDGLDLDGYLSLPKNFADKPIATIILPHGGPMSEDGSEFDRFSAFMVNRGYAVFQPNFRGSSGRGHDFMMQAVGGYGLEMQDDLEDAVAYLVKEKIANPKKVGIVGASYGGYAALMGATKTPDLFQCAISFAGMSDLIKMRSGFRYFENRNVAREQFGNDKQQLKETSPARMADKVKIPILLIHGDKDTSVPVSQSRIMASELKSAGKTYEYLELEDGTHHLDYLPHRQQTFEAMEKFLKQYLPVN